MLVEVVLVGFEVVLVAWRVPVGFDSWVRGGAGGIW